MVSLGDSLTLPKPNQSVEHLWIVITKPDPVTRRVILVGLTTKRPHSDTTTILVVGDHPFINRDSVIFYADARMVDEALLDNPLLAPRKHKTFSCSVLSKIQGGVLSSPQTPGKIKEAYKKAIRESLI